MPELASARALVRLGAALLLVAAAASVWELCAMQAPSSPIYVAVLPGPVGKLRAAATTLGLAMFAAAWLTPWIGRGAELPWLVRGASAGSLLLVGTLTYGATTGMYGVQAVDPRFDSQLLFYLRSAGEIVLGACLVEVARRLFSRPPPPGPS